MNCNFANDILLYLNQFIQISVEFGAVIVKFFKFLENHTCTSEFLLHQRIFSSSVRSIFSPYIYYFIPSSGI